MPHTGSASSLFDRRRPVPAQQLVEIGDCLLQPPSIGVIPLVRQHGVGSDFTDQMVRPIQIAGLSGRQMEAQRIAQDIAKRMDPGSSPGQALVLSPPFDRPMHSFFLTAHGPRPHVDERARSCCRSSRIHCRHLRLSV